MNVSATLNFFRLIKNPSLCLPHATISTFNDLPIPLSAAFGKQRPDIRAVVLDKDNCFAKAKENVVYKPYSENFQSLRTAYPGSSLLIVSNSAGTDDDPNETEATQLADTTGVRVFRHSTKKPGCGSSVLRYLQEIPGSTVTSASQVAVVGDRLFTDVMMANMMGAWAIWVKEGVVKSDGPFAGWERKVPDRLARYGWMPPMPLE